MDALTLPMMFLATSSLFSIPPGLLSALCYVESGHKVKAVNHHDGGSASLGVCQVKMATAKMLGFKGSIKELRLPKTNIYYAGAYLNYQLRRYTGDVRKAVAAYNAGKHRIDSRGITLNKRYLSKVFRAWEEQK